MNYPRRILLGLLFGSGVFFVGTPPIALAYQDAKVTEDGAEVFVRPSTKSNSLLHLKKGEVFKSSSKWVTDASGINWYKIFVKGRFGFIKSNYLETSSIKRELAGIKIETTHHVIPEEPKATWNFLFRGMLSSSFLGKGSSSIGNDLEFSYSIPPFIDGVGLHMLSVGVSILNYVPNDLVLAGTIIVRIPLASRWVPEVRLRVGNGFSQGFETGGAFGIQYPFSIYYGAHISGYAEVGSMLPVSTLAYYLYGSAGLGIHF